MAKTGNMEMSPEQQSIQEQLRRENEYIIKNKRVRRQSRFRTIITILLLFLLIIALLAGAVVAITQFVEDNNFRVSVSHTGAAWLSLSKDYDFTDGGTSVLDVSAPKNMDNCTLCNYLDHKLLEIYNTEGSYEGEGADEYFIATSFYLKNTSKQVVKYREIISIDRAMKGMEQAIRVMVIKDIEPPDDENYGTITVYAAPKLDDDGNVLMENGSPVPEEVVPPGRGMYGYRPESITDYENFTFNAEDIRADDVWMTKPFLGDGYVMNNEAKPELQVGQVIKYTVVIWLEGQDAQCVDAILNGQVKLAVEFAIGE